MGQIVQFIAAEDEESLATLQALAGQPNLKFLKIFPRKGPLSRTAVVEAFHDAFQQIGGVSRLSLWADAHPDEFFKLYARLLPPSSHPDLNDDKNVVVRHVLPPTALDGVALPALPAPKEE
jgi:hypothetical protein